MFGVAASDIAVWTGTALAVLLAGHLVLRRGPRPGAWPLDREAGVPAAIAFLGVGAWIMGSLFFASLLQEFAGRTGAAAAEAGPDLLRGNLAEGLGRLLAIALVIVLSLTLIRTEDPMRSRPALDWRAVLWGVALYLLLLPLVAQVSPAMGDGEDAPQEAVRQLVQTRGFWPHAVFFLNVVMAAPVHEELVFRGLLQGALRRLLPPPVAILLQALLFALCHPGVVAPVFLLGLLLGVLYERSRGLALPLLVHFLHNLITFLYVTIGLP